MHETTLASAAARMWHSWRPVVRMAHMRSTATLDKGDCAPAGQLRRAAWLRCLEVLTAKVHGLGWHFGCMRSSSIQSGSGHALRAGNVGHVNEGMQPLQAVSARRIRSGAHESTQEAGTSARWPARSWKAKAWRPVGGTTTRVTGASEGRRTGAAADTHEHRSIGRVAMAGHGAREKLVSTGRIYGRDLRSIGCVCRSAVGRRRTPAASDSDRGAQRDRATSK